MEKKIRKKYYSEEAVKKALQIDSFRNLSKEKVMEFTSMIPYMEKEVAMEVIKQFPVYVDFAKTVIEHYTQICETILATNKEEYEKAVDAHQFVLESFSKQLENENLTAEERANLSDKMIAEAEKIEVIPTLVLYRDGKAIDSIVAPESKIMIENFINEALEK